MSVDLSYPTVFEAKVRDPLSQVTRNERRSLLAVSTLGITLVVTGLVPTKIEALGVEFTQTDQKALLAIIAISTAYFLVAFTIYAVSDFIAWRFMIRNVIKEAIFQRAEELKKAENVDSKLFKNFEMALAGLYPFCRQERKGRVSWLSDEGEAKCSLCLTTLCL